MLNIIKSGVLSSIQDLGRVGYRHLGVSQCGALDPIAFQLANLLVNNAQNTPVIEITIGLAQFQFTAPVNFAITGGDLSAKLNGQPLYSGWRYFANADDTLTFSTSKSAQRAYLAIQGGIEISEVLGAKSTDIQANFGGFNGRALNANDQLTFTPCPTPLSRIGVQQPAYTNEVRVLKGPHCDKLPDGAFEHLLKTTWHVSELNNRMGSRLTAKNTVQHNTTIASQGVHPGVIQLPPNGEPIVLLNDCQTTGGYPIIATVINADLRLFSQLGTQQIVQFVQSTVSQAYSASEKLSAHLAQFTLAKNNK
ncbi:5-oxoprolinase subunit C family protein [Pseudoalteromonas aurantia]|uniref:Allophanate hydrolase n=1 Tax=Pseudoalteromonas aurantia 208 TaxID=1314867 RepID=A0ABR9EBS9_9GAMM|nr:biotin-dependent carboxyltransferase family protein [Pseudoalteromonas aurantia]MBE0368446.1 allophanate hydrolase [Pseudoalteromonas aurantia 208]